MDPRHGTCVVFALFALAATGGLGCGGAPCDPSPGLTGSSGSGGLGTSATSGAGGASGGSGATGTAPPVTVNDLTGQAGEGYADGPPGQAQFGNPAGMALDAQGNLYIADTGNNRIRVVDPQGNATTLAGNGWPGFVDGTGTRAGTAKFSKPSDVAVDGQGVVYVADTGNDAIRRIDASGNVTTLAGHPFPGHEGDPTWADGTGGPSGTALLSGPAGVALDGRGNILVADTHNSRIRRIDSSGNVTTIAGNGVQSTEPDSLMGAFADGTGGPNGTASFGAPEGIAVDASGMIYVADTNNSRIRKIDPQGNVTTLAGNGNGGLADGSGGAGGVAEFVEPQARAIGPGGTIVVADTGNSAIRVIDSSGNTTTLAIGPTSTLVELPSNPVFNPDLALPAGIAVAPSGNIYVAGHVVVSEIVP